MTNLDSVTGVEEPMARITRSEAWNYRLSGSRLFGEALIVGPTKVTQVDPVRSFR
jgi:hypothetical protein